MFEIICVTNRLLCRSGFLEQIARIAASGADGIILREKDLPESEYARLAASVMRICLEHGVRCVLHSYDKAAARLRAGGLHMPLAGLHGMDDAARAAFKVLGASCHSVEDVLEAERLGCTYVTLGHIYETACKPGLAPRGIELLKSACASAQLPVYAIGGIGEGNIAETAAAGAAGACIMSGFMASGDPAEYVRRLRERVDANEKLQR